MEFASFWALSDDNIRERNIVEVKYLFDLLTDKMVDLVERVMPKNIRLHFVGDRRLLREDCQKSLHEAEKMTEKNTGMRVIVAIGYGGQEEIARAVCELAKSGADMTKITRDDIFAHLETAQFPPVDLIVRTGGHIRHS